MRKNWYIITFSLVIFLHFSPISISNISITLILLTLPFWNYFTFKITKKIKKMSLLFLGLALILPIINLNLFDISEFLKTYLLYFIFTVQIFILFSYTIKKVNIIYFTKILIITQYIIIGYSSLQFILFKYYNNPLLFNPWQSFQAFNEYNYMLYTQSIRAVGFYLEPSVLGLVIIMFFWIRHILTHTIEKNNLIITIIGLYITNSLSAYISLIGILIYFYFVQIKNKFSKYLILFLILIIIGISLPYIPRINEYSVEGSSIYWRFIAPSIILSDLIPSNLFGLPFGSYTEIVKSYGLYNGSNIGSSIDNGHLLYIYYFGIIYIIFLILLVLYFLKTSNYYIKSYIIYFLIAYNFTGAIFNIEYIYLIILLPIITIKILKENKRCKST